MSVAEAGDSRHRFLLCGNVSSPRPWAGRIKAGINSGQAKARKLDFTGDPVDGDALHPADAGGDDVLPPRLVPLGPGDPVQAHVSPVDGVVGCGDAQPRLTARAQMDAAARRVSQTNKLVKGTFLLQHGPFPPM